MGILQRYVIGEVMRSFGLALLTMTAIFVLFMVAAQARDIGLSPSDIVHLVPYVVPSTLPYTVPVSLLFAATVVYGRLAGDNEIIAIKTAGLSVWRVLLPILTLGSALSLWLLYISGGWIPDCTHNAKLVLFKDTEDMFYKLLAKEGEFNHPKWPFFIKVREVQGSKMIDATFKHKTKGTNDYDAIVQAKTAVLHFYPDEQLVRIFLEGSETRRLSADADVFMVNNDTIEMPIPRDSKMMTEKKIQEFTSAELMAELAKSRKSIETVRKREGLKAAFDLASGRFDAINWGNVNSAFRDQNDWIRKCNEFETEWQLRISMAVGSVLFVFLGGPVGILFAKRDFLSAFMTCFMPIIGLYYPLMLVGTNVSKEGLLVPFVGSLAPVASLWVGNVVLAVMAGFVLPSVVKH